MKVAARILLGICDAAIAIDRRVQSVVDAGAFFFMRRGVSKGAIRWTMTMTLVASWVVGAAATWPYRATHPWSTGVLIAFAVLVTVAAGWMADDDALADARGMASTADAGTGREAFWKLWVPVVTAMPPSKDLVAACSAAGISIYRATDVVAAIAFLGALYLKRTPRTPPPAKRTVPEAVTA